MCIDSFLQGHETINWQPSARVLPMENREHNLKYPGLLIICLGVTLTAMTHLAALHHGLYAQQTLALNEYNIIALLVMLSGLLTMYAGLYLMLYRRTITITDEAVGFKRGGLIPANWQVPRSEYSGIGKSEKTVIAGEGEINYTLYRLTLKHRHDQRKDVLLYQSRSPEKWDQHLEDYCTLLNMPRVSEIVVAPQADNCIPT
jgi:hypothetical protein